MNDQYIPGVCNIGIEEIKRRKRGILPPLVVAIILIAALLFLHANHLWRLTLFLPVTSFAISVEQWYYKFCVGFGTKGIFNFGELGKYDTVEQAEFRKKDRNKVRRMVVTGLLVGVIVALVFYYLSF